MNAQPEGPAPEKPGPVDEKLIQSVNREVFRRFPELKGYKPKARAYRGGKNQPYDGYIFLYSTAAEVLPGKQLVMQVRVLTDRQGKIVRVTTSR